MDDSLNSPSFEEMAILLHGNVYDYSEVMYYSGNTRVTIECDRHGSFQRTPQSHLSGYGCPSCSDDVKELDQVKIVGIFKELFGDKYKYPDLSFKKYNDTLTVVCPFHGEFKRAVRTHLTGKGCTLCVKDKKSGRSVAVSERMEADLLNTVFTCGINGKSKTSLLIKSQRDGKDDQQSLLSSVALFKVFVYQTLRATEGERQHYVAQFEKELKAAHRLVSKEIDSHHTTVYCVVATDSSYRKSFDDVTEIELHWHFDHEVKGTVKKRNIKFK